MPYIKQEDREYLDPYIKTLSQAISTRTKLQDGDRAPVSYAGMLNYCCTRLALMVANGLFGHLNYWVLALISGVFSNINSEFYRRVMEPYENEKISQNGDVEEYREE
jgi:hypothetical protein